MFKAIILLRRPDGSTVDEFRHWWLEEHAPRAARLPGVRRIVFNVLEDGSEHDGVSELWFDSREAFEAAYASDVGQAVAADSIAHVGGRIRLLVDGEHTIVG